MTEKEMIALEMRYIEACNEEPVLLGASISYLLSRELPVMGKTLKRKFNRDILPYCRVVLSQKCCNNENK